MDDDERDRLVVSTQLIKQRSEPAGAYAFVNQTQPLIAVNNSMIVQPRRSEDPMWLKPSLRNSATSIKV